ncbi:hypothetical protein ACO0QE_000301 [Hanseniaspora vineae]
MYRLQLNNLTFKRGLQLLGNLKPSSGSTQPSKRVGRGASSGYGKTSGRGTKGQKARGKAKCYFEGGQTPIYKLFPKIGFKQPDQREFTELTLDRIAYFYMNGKLNDLQKIDMKVMSDIGLVTGIVKNGGVKIIGGKSKDLKSYKGKLPSGVVFESCKSTIEMNGSQIVNRFYSELNLRALLKPEKFLEKYSRLPLQSRPTRRKDIDYYTNYEHRGYLSEEVVSKSGTTEDKAFAAMIAEAKSKNSATSGESNSSKLRSISRKKTPLELQIDKIKELSLSNAVASGSVNTAAEEKSRIISYKDL